MPDSEVAEEMTCAALREAIEETATCAAPTEATEEMTCATLTEAAEEGTCAALNFDSSCSVLNYDSSCAVLNYDSSGAALNFDSSCATLKHEGSDKSGSEWYIDGAYSPTIPSSVTSTRISEATEEICIDGPGSRLNKINVKKNATLEEIRGTIESEWPVGNLASSRGLKISFSATVLSESSEATEEITIYGARCRSKKINLKKNATLKDLRNKIESEWTLTQAQNFIGTRRLPISFSKDGKQIPFEQEENENAESHGWELEGPKSSASVRNFLLGMIGWNYANWFQVGVDKFKNDQKWNRSLFQVLFFAFFFVLDLIDTIIDLATGYQAMTWGTEGSENYGVLLFVMTILARILTGWYGVAYSQVFESGQNNRHLSTGYYASDINIVTYFFVELCVFIMEDGAATLYLLNNPSIDSVLDQMNLYLTTICGICCCSYLLINFRMSIDLLCAMDLLDNMRDMEEPTLSTTCRLFGFFIWIGLGFGLILFYLFALGAAISVVVLLAKEILMNNDGGDHGENVEDPLFENETLQKRWLIAYSVGSALSLLVASFLIRSLKSSIRWS